MSNRTDTSHTAWSATRTTATVDADPARDGVQTVEGPTLHDREIEFGRGIAAPDRSPTCFGRSSRASAFVSGPGRFTAALVTMLAVAVLAAGCGGDDAATVDPAAATPAADASGVVANSPATDATGTEQPGDVGADDATPGLNELANADARTGLAVNVSKITPKKFAKAHCRKPIMVVLYQPGSSLETKLLAEAQTAARKLGGDLVTLVYTPADVKLYGDLPAKLGLLSTPGLATVSRDGTIENFWTTYVDNALILRSLQNAAAAKPCSVSVDDVTNETATKPATTDLGNAALVARGGKLPADSSGALASSSSTAAAVSPT